jgi:hypothetical protein
MSKLWLEIALLMIELSISRKHIASSISSMKLIQSKTKLFSNNCVATNGQYVTVIALYDNESSLRVNMAPDCAGETGTARYFTIECAFDELVCSGGVCYYGAQKSKSI